MISLNNICIELNHAYEDDIVHYDNYITQWKARQNTHKNNNIYVLAYLFLKSDGELQIPSYAFRLYSLIGDLASLVVLINMAS